MKLLIILLMSILVGCGNDKYQLNKTVESNGLLCTKYDMKPVSGTLYDGKNELGNYIDGKRDGIHRRWHENGQLIAEGNNIDGKLDGIIRMWHENGQLIVEGNYINGKEDGIIRSWHENGQLLSKGNYMDGKKDGIHRVWHSNGQLIGEGNFIDGKADGIHKTWHENGQLIGEGNFIDGKADDTLEKMESSNDEKTDDKQQSNWTESDRSSFKADCKRGLEDSNSSLTQSQRTEYCDCTLGKIESNYPNKYSQQNMEVMKRLAKSCLQGL